MKIDVLHLVSLDVPVPPDYGGAIDIFYRAKALKSLGIKVILHCFEYGRGTDHDFSEICDEVHFYKRKKSLLSTFKSDPFIVATRKSEELIQQLQKDDYPILLEGHHCSGILNEPALKDRKKFVRVHNIEWVYYDALSHANVSTWKKTYFKTESKKLKKFDNILKGADALFCLSNTELEYYKNLNPNSYLWPVGCEIDIEGDQTIENFALFHGNLSIAENEKALRWIVEVWKNNKLSVPLKIAGKTPPTSLKKYLEKFDFIELIPNPSHNQMNDLISAAAMNLLITFQSTGIKLKLLNSLIKGNHCIVNPLMIEGTDLGRFCTIIDDENELKNLVISISESNDFKIPAAQKEDRLNYLRTHFDAKKNAEMALEIFDGIYQK